MSPISTHAESLRETSRARDGKFGEQSHADPGLVDVPNTAMGPLGVLPERVESEERELSWWDFTGPWGLLGEDEEPAGGDLLAEAQGRVDPVSYVAEEPWSDPRRGLFIGAVLSGVPVAPVVLNERFPLGVGGSEQTRDWWPTHGPDGEPTLGVAVLAGRERFLALHLFTDDKVAVPAGCFHPSYVASTEPDEHGQPVVRYSRLTAAGRDWAKSRLRVKSVRLQLPDAKSEQAASQVLSWA